MKTFLTSLWMTSILLGFICSEAGAETEGYLKVVDDNSSLTLTWSNTNSSGDPNRQTLPVHLLMTENNVTTLNYTNDNATLTVVGGRVLVIDLHGFPLNDNPDNLGEDVGLVFPNGGVGTVQILFGTTINLTTPVPVDEAQVVITNLFPNTSANTIEWELTTGPFIPG